MKSRRALATLVAAVLMASPATAFAAKDSGSSSAQYEAQQIKEGKAKGGKMLAPTPENLPQPGPPPGTPGAMPITPPPASAPPTLEGTALIVAIIIAVGGVALFVDIRHSFT
jgi:hypothetical protein